MAKTRALFYSLLTLTSFFILLEISFFILCNHLYLGDFNFVSKQLQIPIGILPGIIGFICAQLLAHLAYCILIWYVTCALAQLFHLSIDQRFNLALTLFLLGLLIILLGNSYLVPNAKISGLVHILVSDRVAKYLFYALSAIFGAALLLVLIEHIIARRYLVLSLLSALTIWLFYPMAQPLTNPATADRPNIIIVGLDSVRPDYLSYGGHTNQTPFIDNWLKQASVFNNAYTPLARTFPSWVSILTGEYPRQHGVRTNLSKQIANELLPMLPNLLRQQGYSTMYASDETRFSNIDTHYGFDKVVTPPVGLNDFLLGTFNDFPLSNLIINTRLGRWLFPYSYANRPAFVTYNPNSFITMLKPHLLQTQKQPLFLAIHFCLPHYPYLWQNLSGESNNEVERYALSIVRADQQLKDFFALLQQAKLLDHAIVVLLSDHGEALELPGDRITEKKLFIGKKGQAIPKFYESSFNPLEVNQSVGHGTDVLGLPQYHSLLAFRLYGLGEQKHRDIADRVALTQIKPTLLDMIHLPTQKIASLATFIHGTADIIPQQHIFLESDFSPEAIHTVHPETRDVLFEGVALFQIDPVTNRLVMRDDMVQKIIDSKQRADLYGDWILALYPQNEKESMPILVNLKSGQWTNDLSSSLAKRSPAKQMLQAMRAFYGKELSQKNTIS